MITIIQFRTDETLKHEQEIFDRILGDKDHKYISIFEDANLFEHPDVILSECSKIILAGSGELFLSKDDDERITHVRQTIYPLINRIMELDFPTLGICFGHQLIAEAAGGKVESTQSEMGGSSIEITEEGKDDPIFNKIKSPFNVLQAHDDSVTTTPITAILLASSETCPTQAFKFKSKIYTIQFHAEMTSDDFRERMKVYADQVKEDIADLPHIEGPHLIENFVNL